VSAPRPDPPPDRPPAWTTEEELHALVERLLEHQEPSKDYRRTPEAWVEDRSIPELRDLIEAFQTAAQNRPKLQQRLIPHYHMKSNGEMFPPLVLRMRRCTFASCECHRLNILCELIAHEGTFEGEASFRLASFARDASFRSATFGNMAWFDEASFGGQAWFNMASFRNGSCFYRTSFYADASFDRVEFSRAARFDFTTFHEDTSFRFARFVGEANYEEAIFIGQATFFAAMFHKGAEYYKLHFHGEIYFTGAEFDRSLKLQTAIFENNARIGFNDVILRAGADILLKRNLILPMKGVVHFFMNKPIIVGEDSKDAKALDYAAVDYNFLRDGYRSQPGTDDEEDICHLKYMKLKRHALAAKRKKTWRERAYVLFDRWVSDLCLGYLVMPWRIPVTGATIVLGLAALYTFNIGNGSIAFSTIEGSAYPMGLGMRFLRAIYFSMITFVTVGYGDITPIGWYKGVAAVEGFLGVSLIALFTVAWARKMIR